MTRRIPPSLAVTIGYQVASIERPKHRRPATLRPGQRYFLLVWPDGLEECLHLDPIWYGSASIRGALEVAVIDVRGGFVVEETLTRNQPSLKRYHYTFSVPPRGRGWHMLDDSHEKHTAWVRLRDWPVVA